MSTISLNIHDYIYIAQRLGYEVLREEKHKPYNLNIVGVRNKKGRVNHFDDTINIYYEAEGKWVHKIFKATTLPGSPSLLKPINRRGTALLQVGQYKYKKGKHKGKYDALVQEGPVIVYRDNDRDLVYDYDSTTLEAGYFGINIHKASFGAKLIGPESYGCQVILEGYDDFMDLINKSLKYRENSFLYTLVEI